MKKYQIMVILVVLVTSALARAADVGVSISVGEPGFYGRLDIDNFPQPRLIFPSPVIIETVPVGIVRRPVYLHVPPGHEKHWRKHCAEYNACGVPVYFAQASWYNRVYASSYNGHGDNDNGHGHDNNDHGGSKKHGHGKGHKK